MFFLAAPIIAVVNSSDLTVTEVRETKVFAGKLGHRILTDLTLKTDDGRAFTIHTDAIKHDLFRPYSPTFKAGDKVKFVAGQPVKA